VNPDQLFAHFKRLTSTLSTTQLASLAAVFVAVVGVLVGTAYYINTPTYAVLFSDMDSESAAAVVTKLKAAKVEYVLDEGGGSVRVPNGRVDELRLDFSSQGMPSSGRIGFEIFDRTAFGTTEFLEHVNYRRALEGELARTMSTISEVQSARVHIAMAKDSLFAADTQQAKASVVLKLRGKKPLAAQTIAAITGLVASSVEDLRPVAHDAQ
jgi:flagellar M-ring protein FliF